MPHLTCSLSKCHHPVQTRELIHRKLQTLSTSKQLKMSPSYSWYSECCSAVTCNTSNFLVNVVQDQDQSIPQVMKISVKTGIASYHWQQPQPVLFVSPQNTSHSDPSGHNEKTHPSLLLQREYITI